jgi:hypothetical protein
MIGLEDGQQGRHSTRLGDHRTACAEYGVTPLMEEYQAGYAIGIQHFCTYDRGYSLGINGKRLDNPCPSQIEDAYLQGYRDGRDYYEHRQHAAHNIKQLEQDIDTNELLISAKEKEIIKLNRKHTKQQSRLNVDDLSFRERQSLNRQFKDLQKLLDSKRDEMADLYHERDLLKTNLEHLQFELDSLRH